MACLAQRPLSFRNDSHDGLWRFGELSFRSVFSGEGPISERVSMVDVAVAIARGLATHNLIRYLV